MVGEDQKLTVSAMEWTARPRDVGQRRIELDNRQPDARKTTSISRSTASRLTQLDEEDEETTAKLVAVSKRSGKVGDGGEARRPESARFRI